MLKYADRVKSKQASEWFSVHTITAFGPASPLSIILLIYYPRKGILNNYPFSGMKRNGANYKNLLQPDKYLLAEPDESSRFESDKRLTSRTAISGLWLLDYILLS